MTNRPKKVKTSTVMADLIPELDVDAVGIVSLAEWRGTKLEETALRLLPQTHSVVIFAMEIYPEILDLSSPHRVMGEASLSDLLDGDANYLNGQLTEAAYDAAMAFRNSGLKALPLPATGCPQDTRFLEAVFSYKHAAQAGGLGQMGWNSLLITPDFGPRVRLSCCLTEAVLEPTHISITIKCEDCRICLDKCPAGALAEPTTGEPYAINKFACCSFYRATGGCVECMRVCPIGRKGHKRYILQHQ